MDYFDLHCDTPYECFFKNQPFYKNSLAVSGEKGKIFDNWKQVFAVWIRDDVSEPYRLYRAVLDGFKEKLREKPDCLTPYFAVEGGAVTEGDTDLLYKLKEDGIRFLTLTWNGENRIAGGVNSEKGLTHFGRRAIEKLNELDIRCDLSHLNEKSFYKAAELADMPLVTHACCRAVCGHKRNLTDDQLRMISDKNGIVGLCLYPAFLGGNVYEKFYENILHLLKIWFCLLEVTIQPFTPFNSSNKPVFCQALAGFQIRNFVTVQPSDVSERIYARIRIRSLTFR